jgi:DNA-binding transcriptional LysR family regulator
MSTLKVPSGRVSIGFPSILAPILSRELFTRVRTAYPQMLLHVSDGNSWLVREKLINGRLDLAVLYDGQSERGMTVEPLLYEELFYFTTDPDPSPIPIAEAARRPLLLAGPGSSSLNVAQEAFKEHGLTVTAAAEIDALGTLCHAVASGMGNSIMPWCALYDGDWKAMINYRRFADATLTRPIALCFSELVQRSPAIDAVADALKTLIRELVDSGTWQGVSLIEPADAEIPGLAALDVDLDNQRDVAKQDAS